MKKSQKLSLWITLLLLLPIFFSCSSKSYVYELDGNQSMCILGKGPGQDAAINPFPNQDYLAIVKNKGLNAVNVRVESTETGRFETIVPPKAKRQVPVKADEVLYFDSEASSEVKVVFKKPD